MLVNPETNIDNVQNTSKSTRKNNQRKLKLRRDNIKI